MQIQQMNLYYSQHLDHLCRKMEEIEVNQNELVGLQRRLTALVGRRQ